MARIDGELHFMEETTGFEKRFGEEPSFKVFGILKDGNIEFLCHVYDDINGDRKFVKIIESHLSDRQILLIKGLGVATWFLNSINTKRAFILNNRKERQSRETAAINQWKSFSR